MILIVITIIVADQQKTNKCVRRPDQQNNQKSICDFPEMSRQRVLTWRVLVGRLGGRQLTARQIRSAAAGETAPSGHSLTRGIRKASC